MPLKKLFSTKSLLERFKCRSCLSIKWKLCLRHLAFRAFFTALIKVELRRVFTVKLEMYTLFTVKTTHSLGMLMILSAARSLLTSEFLSFIPTCRTPTSVITSISLKVGTNIMVEMIWCRTTKEATSALNLAESTIKVFNIYVLEDTVTKKAIIAVTMIFIRELIRDNQTPTWFINGYFLNKHTVLTLFSGLIEYTSFCLSISAFFICHILVICIWGTQVTFRFGSDSVRFCSAGIPGVLAELCNWSFSFWNRCCSWSICIN